MKTYLDCIPCFFKQALETARLAGADEKTQKKILMELSRVISDFSLESCPPLMGRIIYGLIAESTGVNDPFKKIKQKSNALALSLYPGLKKKVESSDDRLLTAAELAIAGNIIDYGVKNSLEIEKEVEKFLNGDFDIHNDHKKPIFDYPDFKSALGRVEEVLYLADNSGEVVFDRVLIEELGKKVIYAVKEKPIINDALIEDACACGIQQIAKVMSSGSDAPGTILDLCSKEFLDLYSRAELIISKGQGNFEALNREKRPIFFLFKAKCPVLARDIGCKVGDTILKSTNNTGL
ncbi:MAG: ARMT1-like domain-containing protein [Candidatus Omnitrophota bacterium]|nr:ARMT1-like domain-containing protein [Candidatus Omnitrophota bacterium]